MPSQQPRRLAIRSPAGVFVAVHLKAGGVKGVTGTSRGTAAFRAAKLTPPLRPLTSCTKRGKPRC